MSALDAVRKKFGNLESGTDKADKSPSVSSCSSSDKETEKFAPTSGSSVSPPHRKTKKFSQLPAELEKRIRAMAARWSYTRDELTEVLGLVRMNPDGWLSAVELDEVRFGAMDTPLTRDEIVEAMRRFGSKQ